MSSWSCVGVTHQIRVRQRRAARVARCQGCAVAEPCGPRQPGCSPSQLCSRSCCSPRPSRPPARRLPPAPYSCHRVSCPGPARRQSTTPAPRPVARPTATTSRSRPTPGSPRRSATRSGATSRPRPPRSSARATRRRSPPSRTRTRRSTRRPAPLRRLRDQRVVVRRRAAARDLGAAAARSGAPLHRELQARIGDHAEGGGRRGDRDEPDRRVRRRGRERGAGRQLLPGQGEDDHGQEEAHRVPEDPGGRRQGARRALSDDEGPAGEDLRRADGRDGEQSEARRQVLP
jgi:hypothetical protein